MASGLDGKCPRFSFQSHQFSDAESAGNDEFATQHGSSVPPAPLRLTIRESAYVTDWWILTLEPCPAEDFLCGGRLIEGTSSEWLAVAEAIDRRGFALSKRCAVLATTVPSFLIWCPRSSSAGSRSVSVEEAVYLAQQIRSKLGAVVGGDC